MPPKNVSKHDTEQTQAVRPHSNSGVRFILGTPLDLQNLVKGIWYQESQLIREWDEQESESLMEIIFLETYLGWNFLTQTGRKSGCLLLYSWILYRNNLFLALNI